MKRFICACGQELFFENTLCQGCGRPVGYDPVRAQMVTLEPVGDGWSAVQSGQDYVLCANRIDYGVCNAVLDAHYGGGLCIGCGLNRTVPDTASEENRRRWARLEQAKRRLIFGLLALGLPLEAPVAGFPRGLRFDFLEDQRSDPLASEAFITTGHSDGVITINLMEADELQRAWQRQQSNERYRTLLGHFRHEAGHYYFELLVYDRAAFTRQFGDADADYSAAMTQHYASGPLPGWEMSHVSAYASAHPLEDWAETFAHYLHLRDTLETAHLRGCGGACSGDFEAMLTDWDTLAVTLNELNRSLGLGDAYPFVISAGVADKLRFVHAAVMEHEGS